MAQGGCVSVSIHYLRALFNRWAVPILACVSTPSCSRHPTRRASCNCARTAHPIRIRESTVNPRVIALGAARSRSLRASCSAVLGAPEVLPCAARTGTCVVGSMFPTLGLMPRRTHARALLRSHRRGDKDVATGGRYCDSAGEATTRTESIGRITCSTSPPRGYTAEVACMRQDEEAC